MQRRFVPLIGVLAALLALVLGVLILIPDHALVRALVDDSDRVSRQRSPSPSLGRPERTRPTGKAVTTIGVASANAYRLLGPRAARADWDRLTTRRDVDLIGWQESKSAPFRKLYPEYREKGWETWFWPDPDTGPISLAISWRTSMFDLTDVETTRMHRGGRPRASNDPFPARWVVQATFRHRETGRTVILLNTHVNQHIETGKRFETNLNARRAKVHLRKLAGIFQRVSTDPSMTVIGTGDYNFDYADDSTARPRGGISEQMDGVATSSYQALGLRGLPPTRNTRWIDYVFLANGSTKAQFATHHVLTGAESDHSPLLARIRLYP